MRYLWERILDRDPPFAGLKDFPHTREQKAWLTPFESIEGRPRQSIRRIQCHLDKGGGPAVDPQRHERSPRSARIRGLQDGNGILGSPTLDATLDLSQCFTPEGQAK
jgi:hypothetical protein